MCVCVVTYIHVYIPLTLSPLPGMLAYAWWIGIFWPLIAVVFGSEPNGTLFKALKALGLSIWPLLA